MKIKILDKIKTQLIKHIINKYQIFYFISKVYRKTLPKKNKVLSILFLFYNIILETTFDLVTAFKFSKLERKDDYPEKEYNGPRSTMCVQLIGIIYYIYFGKKISFFNKYSAFMDVGCGTGKVLFFSKLIFNKNYGIELNSYHYKKAKKNFKNSDVTIIKENVLDLQIPSEVNFFFLFSPFSKKEDYNKLIDILINHSKDKNKKIIVILGNGNAWVKLFLKKRFNLLHKQSYFDYFENYFLSYN
jgi:SAM-dependent methyltransferase